MASIRHKVFVSYYHEEDQWYRDQFETLFADYYDIMVSKSVDIGDIDPKLKTETIRQKIRDEYIRDATVTIVLVGKDTWRRKHVDWEISSSIRDTDLNPRCGLLGILLPSYFGYSRNEYNPDTIPPRLYKNMNNGFATLHGWSEDPEYVQLYIHEAFERRISRSPDNSLPLFGKNR